MLLMVNMALFLALFASFGRHSGVFSDPWNGPTIATVVMTAATIVLASVTLMVGLLALWGYTTLKEQAVRIARDVADAASRETSERIMRDWIATSRTPSAEDDISRAYERKEGSDASGQRVGRSIRPRRSTSPVVSWIRLRSIFLA